MSQKFELTPPLVAEIRATPPQMLQKFDGAALLTFVTHSASLPHDKAEVKNFPDTMQE